MILSMTGFGAADRHEEGGSYRVEIRSVNNRYFKAAIKLPEALAGFETEVEKQLRTRLGRGSVSYTLRARDDSSAATVDINGTALQTYLRQLRGLDGGGEGLRIDPTALLALPGVCQPRELDEVTRQRYGDLITELTDEAIARLLEMRRAEGQALRRDLVEHCQQIRERLEDVRQRAPAVVEEYHKKLRVRANALLAESQLELAKEDLIREVAVFAERCDVSEEIARLLSHLDQFVQLCDSREEAGRKLDFLAQEMLREANTIGSKANDAAIARRIVEIKAIIDRIKEQVQNVA